MQKKVSLRQCASCKEYYLKKELRRFVKSQDGKIFFDSTSKVNGRGIYICDKCLNETDSFISIKSLSRCLKKRVDDEEYNKLKDEYTKWKK